MADVVLGKGLRRLALVSRGHGVCVQLQPRAVLPELRRSEGGKFAESRAGFSVRGQRTANVERIGNLVRREWKYASRMDNRIATVNGERWPSRREFDKKIGTKKM